VLTSDESWFTHYNPHQGKWAKTGAHAGQRARPTSTKEKTMVVVFWSFTGFFFVTALPPGQTYNSEYVATTLVPQLEAKREETRPAIGLGGTKLHWDNARPHIAESTKMLLQSKGVHILPHPPYSPDLAPSDFYLFGMIKNRIRGRHFTTSDEIVTEIREIFEGISKTELQRVYNTWLRRLEWVIENHGGYYTDT